MKRVDRDLPPSSLLIPFPSAFEAPAKPLELQPSWLQGGGFLPLPHTMPPSPSPCNPDLLAPPLSAVPEPQDPHDPLQSHL